MVADPVVCSGIFFLRTSNVEAGIAEALRDVALRQLVSRVVAVVNEGATNPMVVVPAEDPNPMVVWETQRRGMGFKLKVFQ